MNLEGETDTEAAKYLRMEFFHVIEGCMKNLIQKEYLAPGYFWPLELLFLAALQIESPAASII